MSMEQVALEPVTHPSAQMEATEERESEREAPVLPVSQLSPPQPRPDDGESAEVGYSIYMHIHVYIYKDV